MLKMTYPKVPLIPGEESCDSRRYEEPRERTLREDEMKYPSANLGPRSVTTSNET
jgi:hypothetical protein